MISFHFGHISFERSLEYPSGHTQNAFRNKNLYFGSKVCLAFITEKGITDKASLLLNFSQTPLSPLGFSLGLQCPPLSSLYCLVIARIF